MDVKLPEKFYIDLVTRFLIPPEIKTMTVEIVHGRKAKKITPAQAKSTVAKVINVVDVFRVSSVTVFVAIPPGLPALPTGPCCRCSV